MYNIKNRNSLWPGVPTRFPKRFLLQKSFGWYTDEVNFGFCYIILPELSMYFREKVID